MKESQRNDRTVVSITALRCAPSALRGCRSSKTATTATSGRERHCMRTQMRPRQLFSWVSQSVLLICCAPIAAYPAGHCAFGTLPGRWVDAPPTPETQAVRLPIQCSAPVVYSKKVWSQRPAMCADGLAPQWQEAGLEDLQPALPAAPSGRQPGQPEQQPWWQPGDSSVHWRIHRPDHQG